jgi:hypothetical protein
MDGGNFLYGDTYNVDKYDGAGGTYNISGTHITAYGGQIVHNYSEVDGATGYPMNYYLFFDASDNSLKTSAYIASGTYLGYDCSTTSDTDAYGTYWSSIILTRHKYADGSGGFYYVDLRNSSCGADPSGFYYSYSRYPLNMPYQDQYGSWQTWNAFMYQVDYNMAIGGGNSQSGTSYENQPPWVGYTFYSYYDGQTHDYNWDGGLGYYISVY